MIFFCLPLIFWCPSLEAKEAVLTLADGSRQIVDNGLNIRDFYVGLMAVLFGSMQAGQMVRQLGCVDVSDFRVADRRRPDSHFSRSSADAAPFAFAPGVSLQAAGRV